MNLKLKISPAIVLVGFMGCGKSSVGRLLGERLGWTFLDLDEEIERRTGASIATIFESEGEPKFREIEHEALLEQLAQSRQGRPRVLAVGGGAFVDPRNRAELEMGGVAIFLDCAVEVLWERVSKASHRPLARNRDDFERLYRERLAGYRRADFTVAAGDRTPGQVVDAILKLPLF